MLGINQMCGKCGESFYCTDGDFICDSCNKKSFADCDTCSMPLTNDDEFHTVGDEVFCHECYETPLDFIPEYKMPWEVEENE